MATRGKRGGDREPMSKVDTAWLRMERPTNLMMITGVLMLDGPFDVARFKRLLAERFLAFRRFRQRAVDTPSGAFWETDPDFDMDWHVRVAALPGKADKRQLEQFVSELASTQLDHSKPLWQFHVVEKYEGGSALVTRIHHCYADGIALIQVFLSLTDAEQSPEKKAELAKAWFKEDRGSVLQRLLQPARAGFDKAVHISGKVVEKGAEMYAEPEKAAALLKEGGEIARELKNALMLPDDPVTPLRNPLGVIKRCAWAEPLDLGEVKAISRGLNCTVNDVLLASAAGALRSYLIDCGEDVDGLTIRATVPVNLRPLEHAKKLGNHFGLVFLELPIGEPNPLRRLERVAECMRELKRSRQAIVAFGLLAALGMGPSVLQGPALELLSRKATTVATNVPGPQMPLYLAGSRVREQMFWVPQTGSIGLGISILSYNGRVHFGFIADSKCVPDPDEVIRRFAPEFEKLLLITMMEDWDADITAADAAATLRRFVDAHAPREEAGTVAAKATPKRRLRGRSRRKPKAGNGGSFAKEFRRFRQRQ
ncbi:MAG TPA: wax ester/triacylglycerol synthase family O-acyltransferase [Xanthomonadales bacterium]|nr:wax ester/triacylglycerol synthase family O-acyltransferase [Xanthomonadales bacterium]